MPLRNAACRDFLLFILVFKGVSERSLYKSFGVKGLKVRIFKLKTHHKISVQLKFFTPLFNTTYPMSLKKRL
jgi:hypothetical protein